MKLKKITIQNIEESIDRLKFIKSKLEKAEITNEKDLREYVCKQYIEIQNVSKVAEKLNEEGHRLKERKFIGKDVSDIIVNTKDSDISIVAKAIFQYNNTLQSGKKNINKLIEKLKLGDKDESRTSTRL